MSAMAIPIHLHLLLLAVLAMPVPGAAQQSTTNITSGSSLQAAAGAAWLSPSGHFTFGFYATTDGGLAVGVWLDTSPNVTITWTTDRNDTPTTGGALWIAADGRLVWAGATEGQDRSVAAPAQPAVAAAMRDDGSFVLYDASGAVVWSTISAPTDTLLPGQDLPPGVTLFSSASPTDRATGRYRLANQLSDGNLVMYPVQTRNVAAASYWNSGTIQLGFLLTLRLDATGVLC